MKKALAGLLVCIFIATISMPTVAFAAQPEENSFNYCSSSEVYTPGASKEFRFEVEGRTHYGFDFRYYFQVATLKLMVARANAQIEMLVKIAQATPRDDVEWLLEEVDEIVERVMEYADYIGATVECVYTEYYIDGQYVLVDPLMVVNVSRRGTR